MLDPNNRPGGPNLALTAKNANKVQFFDAATMALVAEIVMPASTHEMVLSPDGAKIYASIYGGGIFGKNRDPDRRIAVIDLAARSLERTIDVGAVLAPHGVMMAGETLWATGELGNVALAIDPDCGAVEPVRLSGSPHWLAVSHAAGAIFASFKTDGYVAVIDAASRRQKGRIEIPGRAEGFAVSPDGETLYVCAHERNALHEFDARTQALRRTVAIEGGDGENQLKRVRVSPDGRWVLAAQNFDAVAAIYEADSLRQVASIKTRKSPMGFGFAADGKHAFLCCHDDAVVLELELSTGRITREFATDKGCEFIIAYGESS
jgi:DNA-binding beta-propeller fold protein YncE